MVRRVMESSVPVQKAVRSIDIEVVRWAEAPNCACALVGQVCDDLSSCEPSTDMAQECMTCTSVNRPKPRPSKTTKGQLLVLDLQHIAAARLAAVRL